MGSSPSTAIPQVSFVVPCYKHGHFLAECVESILQQSYGDFEILVMDDCSPDDTPAIARTFTDPRVIYVRNETNLGHLRNYNKGLSLARGRYLWLINVDDKLRRPHIVERYVRFMEDHPTAGFVFCPAVPLRDGNEGPTPYGDHGSGDALFEGRRFLERLVYWNSIWVPTVMARRACYERAGLFPLDLPYSGDWYLWCHFAFHADVGYLAEPMVHYRLHDANMTHGYAARMAVMNAQEAEVRWRVKRLADEAGDERLRATCRTAIARTYLSRVETRADGAAIAADVHAHFEEALPRYCVTLAERRRMRALLEMASGDACFERSDSQAARAHYRAAVEHNPRELRAWAKYGLSLCGRTGWSLVERLGALRRRIRTAGMVQSLRAVSS